MRHENLDSRVCEVRIKVTPWHGIWVDICSKLNSIVGGPVASGSQILLAQSKVLLVLGYWITTKVEH